jgi:hypothetical protein
MKKRFPPRNGGSFNKMLALGEDFIQDDSFGEELAQGEKDFSQEGVKM